ncbi:hypothetical protein [uncultured Kordia sp.]|uniref:hypothetical protein n=1 Tax=uncultured Kordia sp. TaxID=507699 RepID=UPI0026124C63|nr:hypothetical protein [uncultured Kordia sp.]
MIEIKYLQQLRDNPNLNIAISPRVGWEESKIVALETKYNEGRPFPQAFREYLFLAGDYGGTGVVYEDWDDLREDCEDDIEYWGNKLKRPFFVFDKLDSQYSIFFLDEDKEDPIVYIFNASWNPNHKEELLKKALTGSFSNLINEAIYRIKNNILF